MKVEVNVPDGVSDDWKVETFEITELEAELFYKPQKNKIVNK